ncbi:tat (twin-arginine translocation) pathway signal sequence domain protein [Lysobacter antibioticus]|uniref:Tat (Twin-arginine translocation) pathway signal sequence domain protein n=1 Tax=Lysobacter antibioticus TaxID=84531 RepID=A0A0S2E5L7_LYSAN|nr:DUF1552 domain-containing protein [Lysobacter antibioticus]ALN65679.1 tat (twin-arginine translocation) pathway signal sequence domain protein [Lysobacter antibioticus]ALN81445.1 hypothetical protein LA76x_3319 [Lysobacter antibioticus]
MDILKNRRRFLAGLTAAGVLAPLSLYGLARMAVSGETQAPHLKVVFFVTPDGLAVDSFTGGAFGDGRGLWHPDAQGDDTGDFTLGEVSRELEAYRHQSLYLRGTILGPANVGHSGWKWVLRDSAESKTSIDNLLAAAMPGTDPSLGAVFAGPHAGIDGTHWDVSWIDNRMRIPQNDPGLLFESIFRSAARSGRGQQVRSKDVFAPVFADIQDLNARLAGSQREKLATHLDAVNKVVKDLEDTRPPLECDPQRPEHNPINSAEFRNQVQAAHHQVVATALACGVVRVATIQVGRSAESLNILDVTNDMNPHDCAHRYTGEGPWKGTRQWYTRQVKLFLDELAKHADPDVPSDNLLQHTLVVFTSEMADGAPEHMIDMPLVMLGGASGLLKSGDGQGRYLKITGQADRDHHTGNPVIGKRFVDMQRIWATVGKAAGIEVPYAGNIAPVSGIFSNVG